MVMPSIAPLAIVGALLGSDAKHVADVPAGCQVVEGTLRFARDGSHVAYVAARDGSFHTALDGTLGDAWDEVAAPVMDPLGEHVYFRVMERNSKAEEEWTLLLDGKKVVKSGWVGPVTLSAQGVPAYWVFKDRLFKSGCVFNFGKKKTKSWQTGEMDMAPELRADGKLAMSIATRDDDWVILTLTDKGEEESRNVGLLQAATLSPDGKELLCTLMEFEPGSVPAKSHHYFLQRTPVDEKVAPKMLGETFLSSGSPVYSPDGRRIAYKALRKDGMGVATSDNEELSEAFAFVDELLFSADGSNLAYAACLGGTPVFPKSFDLESKAGCEVLRGVTAKDGKWLVVAGKTRGAEYERVAALTWSPDGTALAYAARKNGAWRVVVGEKQSDPADEITGLVWDASGERIHYGTREGQALWWRELARK